MEAVFSQHVPVSTLLHLCMNRNKSAFVGVFRSTGVEWRWQCRAALCPSWLAAALPSLLMSLRFGRRGRKAREANAASTTSADSSCLSKRSPNAHVGRRERPGIGWKMAEQMEIHSSY